MGHTRSTILTIDVNWPNSEKNFSPLASVGRMAGHCPKHTFLVQVLQRIGCLIPEMMFSFFHVQFIF